MSDGYRDPRDSWSIGRFLRRRVRAFKGFCKSWFKMLCAGPRWLLKWTVSLIEAPFIALFRAIRWLTRALADWWRTSRRAPYFVRGLPALIVTTAVIYLAVAIHLTNASDVQRAYVTEANRAMQRRDFAAAAVYWDRALQLGRDNDESQYQLALAVGELGDTVRLNFLLEHLAPADRTEYPPAHLLQARRILAAPTKTTSALTQAEMHLTRVVTKQPGNLEAHLLLGQLYMGLGKPHDAIPHFTIADPSDPVQQLQLAKAHALDGDARRAERIGKFAADALGRMTQRLPDNAGIRLAWADSLLFLRKFSDAIQVLEQGRRLFPSQDQGFRSAIGRVYVVWSDDARATGSDAIREQFRLLESALRVDPDNPWLFERILPILKKEGATADEARQNLVQLLAEGVAPALLHLLLGSEAGIRGDRSQALYHLKRAHELDPNMPTIANNLAWNMAHSQTPDLAGALALIDPVADQWPNIPQIRDTRGEILLRLGRWDEAVRELEAALPGMIKNARFHASLAKCYRELNLMDLASEHERRAANLAKLSTNAPP